MLKKWMGSLLLAVATLLNLRLFLGRWAEEPRSDFAPILSSSDLASLSVGFGAAVVALALLDALRSLRFLAMLALAAVCAGVVISMPSLGVFGYLERLSSQFLAGGAALAIVCARLRDSDPERGEGSFGSSFALMAVASFNAFLLMAPWTTHVPSYVQGTPAGASLLGFYYGSVHSNSSPVSVGLRWLINSFFAHPSINATALSSMLYLAVGLAMAGVALEMVFGRLWGWALVVLAWTDRWLFSSAVSSAIIGQPVLSTASVLLLCTWALWRKAGPLSWREAASLGAANAAGVLYILYSYSAARMTWLVGSGIAALILLLRRALQLNLSGLLKATAAILPSVMLVALIWAALFRMDTERFKSQLLISPPPSSQIKDPSSYRVPVTPVHDPDIPIWWGTGYAGGGEPGVVYWKRTPQEVYEKLKWFMRQLSVEPPVPFLLVLLGGLGMAVCLASPIRLRRWFGASLIALTLVSFSTFVLAQDYAAYRRGLATNLLLLCGVVCIFAVKCRSRFFKLFSLALCGALAVLKAPEELNALFNDSFWSQACVNCQPMLDVRDLVNDPAFRLVADRPLRFVLRVGSPQALYMTCLTQTVESHEFKELAPNSSVLSVPVGQIAQGFDSLSSGEVMVISCFKDMVGDPQVSGICTGAPPFGKLLTMLPAQNWERAGRWFALVEKQ